MDYELLQIVWFFLWGLLWAVYFMLDGFDLGAGSLMPILARDERDKRMIYNATGPFWDGNEVWIISAGGVTFAAFPPVYASMFSGMYTALMLLLFALILRGVSWEFRGKVENQTWKNFFDYCQTVGSVLPAILLGVAFANIFMGIPLNEEGIFQGGIFSLINIYGLAGGVFFLVMFLLHGALWLGMRTDGDLKERSIAMAEGLWPVLVALVAAFLVLTGLFTDLLANYLETPLLLAILLLPVCGLIATRTFLASRKMWLAWASNCATIVGVTFFGIIGLFPRMLPSSLNPEWSLTAFNSSSSELTLSIMLVVALIFVPIVIGYQAWAYRTFATQMTEDDLTYDEAY